ncbi:hypothetical protein FB451DRAFT_1194679 [Mycena latifolia]|nr:hypothetical protein FB451DRAFT_1194679 [Mycena latifolia]
MSTRTREPEDPTHAFLLHADRIRDAQFIVDSLPNVEPFAVERALRQLSALHYIFANLEDEWLSADEIDTLVSLVLGVQLPLQNFQELPTAPRNIGTTTVQSSGPGRPRFVLDLFLRILHQVSATRSELPAPAANFPASAPLTSLLHIRHDTCDFAVICSTLRLDSIQYSAPPPRATSGVIQYVECCDILPLTIIFVILGLSPNDTSGKYTVEIQADPSTQSLLARIHLILNAGVKPRFQWKLPLYFDRIPPPADLLNGETIFELYTVPPTFRVQGLSPSNSARCNIRLVASSDRRKGNINSDTKAMRASCESLLCSCISKYRNYRHMTPGRDYCQHSRTELCFELSRSNTHQAAAILSLPHPRALANAPHRVGAHHVAAHDLSSLYVLGSIEHVGKKECAVVDTFWSGPFAEARRQQRRGHACTQDSAAIDRATILLDHARDLETLWKRNLPCTSPSIPEPARPSDQIFHHNSFSSSLTTDTICFALRTANAKSRTKSSGISDYAGDRFEVDWAPIFSAERGSVNLPIPDIHILLHDSALSPARPGHFSVPVRTTYSFFNVHEAVPGARQEKPPQIIWHNLARSNEYNRIYDYHPGVYHLQGSMRIGSET